MTDCIEANDENFEQLVLESDRPVLVDFWAPWCGPCRALAPTIEALAEQYAGEARFVKLNIDDNPAVPQRYQIQAVPTLILFQAGEEKDRIIGVRSKEVIARIVDARLGAATNCTAS
jgi:thioredoxin 1